ncbi:MAG TPA: Uma2 family endonuclease [Polyangiaceae bacterium]
MMAAQKKMTYAEYMAFEEASVEKHEFLDGEVFAMAGGTLEHSALAVAFAVALVKAIGDRPCRVFNSDLRVRIPPTGLTTYPDLSVACGKAELDGEDSHALVNPVLIVEVLSDSTEAYDRGQKAAHYRHIDSLKEYALVSQHGPRIEVFRRNEAGRWELYEYERGASCELASVGVSVSVDDVYRDPLAGVA